jgi:hypothetical protein
MKRIPSALILLLPLLASACTAAPSPARPWTVEDLRLLDPVDAASPSTDVLAVYVRDAGSDLEIRLDLLDVPFAPDADFQLLLTTLPGGTSPDLTIDLPRDGLPAVTPSDPQRIPRLVRIPWLDTLTVSLNRLYVPEPFTLQVRTFVPGTSAPADETAAVRSDGEPPAGRARLLLAFRGSLPAASPIQALRRWDGAHTGPNGGRHGLRLLLDAAAQNHLPLALLDLKTPASLAALDFLGRTAYVRSQAAAGQLLLPDVAFSSPADLALGFSRRAGAGFGLPTSPFSYAPGGGLQPGYAAQFVPLPDAAHLALSGGTRLVPLPAADAVQATDDGPAPDVRRSLVEAALSGDPSRLVVLGGDLPHSTWGNADAVSATLAWISAHPWIEALTGTDLLTFPVGVKSSPALPAPETQAADKFLHIAADNAIGTSARLTHLMLNAPTDDSLLQALRGQYTQQVMDLALAAAWATKPFDRATCPDQADQQNGESPRPDCILSNEHFYAVFEPSGGRLVDLFYLDQNGPHQLVAPTSQFTVGLSDPSRWNVLAGERADPGTIAGAFGDDPNALWIQYATSVTDDTLTLTSPDGRRVKTFHLTEAGLEVSVRAPGELSVKIPLAVDPSAFFFGPMDYRGSLAAGAWSWGPAGGLQVLVQSDASLTAADFSEARPSVAVPEDPNEDYPSGAYLPFPVSVVTLNATDGFHARISVK